MSQIEIRQPFLDPTLSEQLAQLSAPRRALFLDRDGVINVNHGYVHSPKQTDWVDGIFEFVARAHEKGFLPVVVTNQAGIGRGYYSELDFIKYTRWVHKVFTERNAPLAATFWCPHHPTAGEGRYRVECDCRKPQPGMLRQAMSRWNINAETSVLIGDKQSDIEAAHAAGIYNAALFTSSDDISRLDILSNL
ncbi:HAD family hydrolase [Lysobacter sp. HDW10]|uniref:D-glycero-alpha-D-manno-heptose-1,7-bisphosphate 7-phosphatase n=1 Tax=Lysobacter sp. HDW10 TaxID=2714936 RepID=UPI00140CD0DA|nr:HAD family hydrolase [Lysobacter sp. HDW10]QIK80427.1 HAD family hydrolase [Lysobacter sp. HDW10]